MAYKMKGFPMMKGTALYQEAYKETRRVKRRRSKSRMAQDELNRLENGLEKLTERFGKNPSDAQKDRLADLRFRIQKAREVADKKLAKYEKLTGRTTKKEEPAEQKVDPTAPNKDANEMLAEKLEEEEYDTAPENQVEELVNILPEEEKEETEEERQARINEEMKKTIEQQNKRNKEKIKSGGGGRKTTASNTQYIKHKGHDTTATYNFG
jgi:hypothetical protein